VKAFLKSFVRMALLKGVGLLTTVEKKI